MSYEAEIVNDLKEMDLTFCYSHQRAGWRSQPGVNNAEDFKFCGRIW